MRLLFSIFTTLVWGLWFGGLVCLFIAVQTLFAVDRSVAVAAAPMIFQAFERYQLLLAAAALVGAVGWRLNARSAWVTAIFALLGLAAIGAAIGPLAVSAPMQELAAQGRSGSAQFMRLHGWSMLLYMMQTILLLLGGLFISPALRSPRTSPETARA